MSLLASHGVLAKPLYSLTLECFLTSFEIVVASLFTTLAIVAKESPLFNPFSMLIRSDNVRCF